MIDIDCRTDGVDEAVSSAIERAVSAALKSEGVCGDVGVAIIDDEQMQVMNRDFRHIDRTTDVLSFPAWEGEQILCAPDGYIGDIAISLPKAKAQAEEYGHSLYRELEFLSVHGSLHLMGYDHIEPEDEAKMRARQKQILEEMGSIR